MEVKAWLIVRDGKPVHVRLDEGQAQACATLEGNVYYHEKIEVVPVTLTENK